MSIRTEINRITAAKTAIASAIADKGVDVPNGTLIDGMAPLIKSIKGGLALDVVTASSLPSAVVDGQIVVITETAPGTVYIDTDEPASPVSGDLWIEVAAYGAAALVLTEESPYLRNGLVSATQWDGSTWVIVVGYMGVSTEWVQFSANLPPVGTALNDMSWADIANVAASGRARNYFAVGDAKQITINGTVGNTTFGSLTAWAFIIGIYHDPEHEGGNFITFQIGKSAQTGGVNLAYTDSKNGGQTTDVGYFTMRSEADASANTGGWQDTIMRQTILGNNGTPSAPLAGSFIAALPSDLRAVMKGVSKYTDNVGGATLAEDSVTPTEDYLWLLSEYEVSGTRTNANAAEKNYQKQYDYYASGNSAKFYRYDNTSYSAYYWLRSPAESTSNEYWCYYATSPNTSAVKISRGICPCFCV